MTKSTTFVSKTSTFVTFLGEIGLKPGKQLMASDLFQINLL